VRAVIGAMIAGTQFSGTEEDVEYCIDQGLIKKTPTGIIISNKIYKEVIPRVLTSLPQLDTQLQQISPPFYVDKSGKLDMEKLLASWKAFYLQNIRIWDPPTPEPKPKLKSTQKPTPKPEPKSEFFREAAVHLLLFAFLQRVINGGGTLDREYAINRDECDIVLKKPYNNGTFATGPIQEEAIELKVWRKSNKTILDTFVKKGIDQLVNKYCKPLQITCGYLLVVDQHTDAPLASRMREETVEKDGCTVYIYYL
jgi:hypothetical protein